MKAFDDLVSVVDELLGPNGCPWDREQTMKSIRSDVLEEVCELIEAIDLEDNEHIQEELGDLFFNVVFLSRLAEKEQRTRMENVLGDIKDKLIRRHPHVFGDVSINSVDQLYQQWNAIKKTEKGKQSRQSALDGIPKGLPGLARAQKIIKIIAKSKFPKEEGSQESASFETEEALGEILLNLVRQAASKGLNAEQALKTTLATLEKDFRDFEINSVCDQH